MIRTCRIASQVAALALLSVVAHGTPVWVSFDGSSQQAVPPSVVVVSGDANHVAYDIRVHGMLVSDTVIEGEAYRRLSFPGEGVLGEESLPELPSYCFTEFGTKRASDLRSLLPVFRPSFGLPEPGS
ncbi:hypothetical protein FJY71_05165 [candidate division WOR-3 bacterium]|nr:hypothetical protein [candidate division WOR-3 bacterium]